MNRPLLLLAAALVFLLSACSRYGEVPSCRAYFAEGEHGAFVLQENGTAQDSLKQLHWYRCNAGQRFAGGQCLGNPLYATLADAQTYAQEFSAASGKQWRLPTVREMATLRQTSCNNPAVNPQVFPGVVVSNYWTSSSSPNGASLGCSSYTFGGNSFCRESISSQLPFMLVLD
jgi:hypothetical protein